MLTALEVYINKHYNGKTVDRLTLYRMLDAAAFKGKHIANARNPSDYMGRFANTPLMLECKETIYAKIAVSKIKSNEFQYTSLLTWPMGLYVCLLKEINAIVLVDAKHLPESGAISNKTPNALIRPFTSITNLPKLIGEYYGLEKKI